MSNAPPSNEGNQHQEERSQTKFDHYSLKYLCCCGFIHVKNAIFVFTIIFSFYLAFTIWGSFHQTLTWQQYFFGYYQLPLWLLWIPVLIFLFIGIFTKNQYLLVPFILYGCSVTMVVIMVTFFSIILILSKIFLSEKYSTMKSEVLEFGTSMIISFILFEAFLQVGFIGWFTWIVNKCHQYFYDLKNYSKKNGAIENQP